MSGTIGRWRLKWAAALVVLLALALVAPANAATLYISEFQNGATAVGTTPVQMFPQTAVTDQTVALSGASAQSNAFNSLTHAVALVCDEGCSISFGTNPTATTSNYLLFQGQMMDFVVSPGQKIAVIANAAGNSGGGSGGGGATPIGTTNFATAQVGVANTATLIAAARTGAAGTGRAAITVTNTGNTAVYLGNTSAVTTSTGQLLPVGAGSSVTINTQSAVYGVAATGSETVTEFETY